MCSASSIWTIRLTCADLFATEAALDALAIGCRSTSGNERQFCSYTAACTGQRSIHQRYIHSATHCNKHSYLHLTCCVCRRIQICSGCSCCRRGRSSFQSTFCSGSDGRGQWLHLATSPGGRAHIPHIQLRNEGCSRKGSKARDFSAIDSTNIA